MTVTLIGGTTVHELMWNRGADRSGAVCQPFKQPPPRRLRTLDDVNRHFATVNSEVNRMTSRVNAFREGRSEFSWKQLKSMCNCLAGQIDLLEAAAARFKGREADLLRSYIAALRSNHEWNVNELEKYRPRFER
jgi:hypothetical protein